MKRGFRPAKDFEVRYWSPGELIGVFQENIGPSEWSVDGFLSLNAQATDLALLSPTHQVIVRVSKVLQACSKRVPWLGYLADSLFIQSRKVA
jgi:hypothetical protein